MAAGSAADLGRMAEQMGMEAGMAAGSMVAGATAGFRAPSRAAGGASGGSAGRGDSRFAAARGMFNRQTGTMNPVTPSTGSVGTRAAAAPRAQPPVPAGGGGVRARAQFDYTATEAGELTFQADDIITNIKKDDSGWWTGQCKGQQGMFPSNYVQEI